jgi:hypothetical protein
MAMGTRKQRVKQEDLCIAHTVPRQPFFPVNDNQNSRRF